MSETMNPYSPRGTLVAYIHRKNGYDSDQRNAEECLVVGNVYRVERTEVGQSRTSVWLQGFPDTSFNSVMFAPAE